MNGVLFYVDLTDEEISSYISTHEFDTIIQQLQHFIDHCVAEKDIEKLKELFVQRNLYRLIKCYSSRHNIFEHLLQYCVHFEDTTYVQIIHQSCEGLWPNTLFQQAACLGNLPLIKYIEENVCKCCKNASFGAELEKACEANQYHIIKYLIEKYNYSTALCHVRCLKLLASTLGVFDCFKRLFEQRQAWYTQRDILQTQIDDEGGEVQLDATLFEIVKAAVQFGNIQIVSYVITSHPIIHNYFVKPLQPRDLLHIAATAVSYEQFSIVQWLFDNTGLLQVPNDAGVYECLVNIYHLNTVANIDMLDFLLSKLTPVCLCPQFRSLIQMYSSYYSTSLIFEVFCKTFKRFQQHLVTECLESIFHALNETEICEMFSLYSDDERDSLACLFSTFDHDETSELYSKYKKMETVFDNKCLLLHSECFVSFDVIEYVIKKFLL